MDISWTNGDGANRVVVMNTTNSFSNLSDAVDYTANNIYAGPGIITNYKSAIISNNITAANVDEMKFVDPAHFDYRLQANSPAINAGKDISDIIDQKLYKPKTSKTSGIDIISDVNFVGVFDYAPKEKGKPSRNEKNVATIKNEVLTPTKSYNHFAKESIRVNDSKIDAGAFEYKATK